MADNRGWKGNTGGGNFGQKALIFLLNFLGLRPLYAVLALVVPFYMLFSRKGYLSVYHYFRKRFGFSVWNSFYKTYLNHFLFGQVILDRFAVFAGIKDLFDVEIIGNAYFERLAEGEKGFIMAGSHVGNFEIGGYLLHSEKKRINALIYAGETRTMQHNRSKVLAASNVNLIPVQHDMSHLFAINVALQNGEIISMTCDRNHGSAKSVECDFLDWKADFPLGAFALAASFEVEVLAVFCIKISAKKYKIFVQPCSGAAHATNSTPATKREQTTNLVKCYAAELETIVKQYPLQWFNYYEFWKK
ncbi:MAG: lipid A biosynthesis (KDO)2-(lauroyl)-lipid IVA acyltransferase [Prevotellaceae bacterium]|jgi:predicted LPLAT superfamily acyltransferase|nr:lipid A biosynthesis (KDO)2-(lauroyl)-lipid IVA acyltransferase [Prevotellaceae bacterium]